MNSKIVIVGTGRVGSTIGYTLVTKGIATQLVLIDRDTEKAQGEALDLLHGSAFTPPVHIKAGDYSDCAGAKIIIIAAGAAQKEGEKRMHLLEKNTWVIQEIIQEILPYNQDGILLIVTNPVDVLTYIAWKASGFPKERVMGTGTVLDTSRLRSLLASKLELDARNIHGYVMGEHGDTEVVIWSSISIAGMGIKDFLLSTQKTLLYQEVEKEVQEAAQEIIQRKGSTCYAIALAVGRIVESILRNEASVLTVSGILEHDPYYRMKNTALSLPTVIHGGGIRTRLPITLEEEELEDLRYCGETIQEAIQEMEAQLTLL